MAFGLASIRVVLYATGHRSEPQFRMLDARDHACVRCERVNEEPGAGVPWDRIVRAFEYDAGNYLMLSDEDFQCFAPGSSHSADIECFVPQATTCAKWFEKPYHLVPDRNAKDEKGYALVRRSGPARPAAARAQVPAGKAPDRPGEPDAALRRSCRRSGRRISRTVWKTSPPSRRTARSAARARKWGSAATPIRRAAVPASGCCWSAIYDTAGALVYAGRVRTGFDNRLLRTPRRRLEILPQGDSPFRSLPVAARRGAHFVVPELVCEIGFSEWIGDGHPCYRSFPGLREDKEARHSPHHRREH
ncbi:MAG: Ku protein [Pseudomonadota bacterium]